MSDPHDPIEAEPKPDEGNASSDESDWDADPDLVDDFKMYMQNQPDYYTMHASGGMVTITPATSKTTIVAAPIEVEVEWTYGGNEVFVYTSFDDFQTAIPLEAKVNEITDELHHVGTVLLPPGRYLIRYLVDGEWMVDDNQEVVCSLGNEYNSILVEDPNAPEQDESSEDDTTVGDDDWGDLDDRLPDNFQSGSSADLFGGKNIDTSKGMVNITPDTFKDLESLTPEERAKIKMAGDMEAVDGRRTSLVWDSHKRAFVIAKADGENESHPDTISEAGAASAPADDSKKKADKERERRKKKKKKRKEKKRNHQQRSLFSTGASSGARNRAQSKSAEVAAAREDILKREREWREAWILHELKTQEEREKEKEAMRMQWKEEREQWILKIKTYSTEAHNLRQLNQELHKQLDEAKSGSHLNQAALQREQDKFLEQQKLVEDELAGAKQAVETVSKQASTLRDENSQLQKDLEQAKSQWRAEVDALRASESKFKLGLEESKRELTDALNERKNLEEQHIARAKEWEAKLESAKKDIELKSQQSSQALNEATQTLEKQLNTRIGELNAALDAKEAQLEQVREQLNAVQKQLAESKRETSSIQGQLDAQIAALELSKKDRAATESEVQALNAKIEQLNNERKELETAGEAKRSELEMQVNKMKASLLHKQKKMDDAVAELEKFKSDAQNRESEFEREREENKRLLQQAQATSAGLRDKVQVVVANSQAIRNTMSGFKEQTLKEVTLLKSGLEDSKKFLLNSISMQSNLLNATMKKYKKELSERRKYFNMVQELKGNIRVFCRCRPFIEEDKNKGLTNAASFPEDNTIRITTDKKDHDFEFDCVFGPEATQVDVFAETKSLVTSCMDGYNVCIFAYGQTGSGKTFTMDGPAQNRGVNYRALTELFSVRDERADDYDYKISVSMLEIYNETIRDLLGDGKQDEKESLKVHKGPQGMYVEGLTEWVVSNEQDVINAIILGSKNRATNVTNMNEHSSRSHSLLSVKVEGYNRTAGITYFGKLHLIDLAGSERVGKSGATGDRLKEAQAINKSLSALGNVIEALQKKASHVPYRNSKLTFLLQDSLGGHAKTAMFINVSPTASDSEETVCSLTFATRVRRVELGGAVRNTGKADEPTEDKGDFVTGDDAPDPDAVAEESAPASLSATTPVPKTATAAAKPAAAKPGVKPAASSAVKPGARPAKSTTAAPAAVKKPAVPAKK